MIRGQAAESGPRTAAKIAGAPISWGVCEVPGWGYQLPPERVFAEMAELGLGATELGPVGFLPDHPQDRRAVLARHRLRAVGGFWSAILTDPADDPLPAFDVYADALAATGGDVVVVAAVAGQRGYDTRPELSDAQWTTLLANLDRIDRRAAERGVRATLHPHAGTLVENRTEVRRVLDGSSIALTLDTGHLMVAGVDPVRLARTAAKRIAHVHLKDVDAGMAGEVEAGRMAYSTGVAGGLFKALGTGDVDIAGLVDSLRDSGYDGWYVLEQDVMLAGEPTGEGPATDVRSSLRYLTQVLA